MTDNTQWSRLDNAGKLFASVSDRADPRVLRFACELTEPVDPVLLQSSLDRTLPLFPPYRSTLRRGLFWYFLEPSPLSPIVEEEHLQPCSPLYDRMKRGLLFSVTYYKNRINLEVYHALSDGTGALQFLRMLVHHYLLLRHPDVFGDMPASTDFDASEADKSDDSFRRYYQKSRSGGLDIRRAYRLRGPVLSDHRMRVISGLVSTTAVLAEAKKRGTTLTSFLTAALMQAFCAELPLRDRKKPVVVTIPVNLRNYFESGSVRNFFGCFNVLHRYSPDDTLDTMVEAVAKTFREELTSDRLAVRMNHLSAIEHNPVARIIPLALKDWGLTFGSWMSDRGVTAALSNVGRVIMPEEFTPYIRLFDVFISTQKLQLCMCSFKDNLVLTITAPFQNTNVQKRFFRMLTSLGIAVTINSNDVDYADSPPPPVVPADKGPTARIFRQARRTEKRQKKQAASRPKEVEKGDSNAEL